MNLKSIRLYSQEFPVVESHPGMWSGNGMGRSSQINGILINSGMPDEAKITTLIHEVLHLIADLNGLNVNNSESEIATLSNGLVDFLRSNKEAAALICGVK